MGFISLVRFRLGFNWFVYETRKGLYLHYAKSINYIQRTYRSDFTRASPTAWQLCVWIGAILIYIQWETN